MNKEPEFGIPAEMRALTEKRVAQAKQAFEGFITAAQEAANLAEGQATTAHTAAKEASSMAIEFAERNMTSAFVLAQKLVWWGERCWNPKLRKLTMFKLTQNTFYMKDRK